MAEGRRVGRKRPSKGAVAGRLVGAFAGGMVVMGGMLYLFERTAHRDAQERLASHATAPAGTAPGALPGVAGGVSGGVPGGMVPGDGTARGKAAAGTPAGTSDEGTASGGTVAGGWPQAPFGESEEVFETGARVYAARCASCHGRPGKVVGAAGQFWGAGAAAVSAEPAGKIYTQTAHGVPGMPGYQGTLRETEMWDVALLLRNAGQELPDPVVHLLRHGGN